MANAEAKGDLALTVDELGLEASLRFTPNPSGGEWTADKLMRLVMDARIGGVNPKRAEDLLSKFSRSHGPVLEVIARGVVPEESVPEEAEWVDLTPPPELDAIVAATIAAAPPPELFRVRVETIRSEKIVRKPGALPFLPAKEEKVAVQERREIKERIYPDLEILTTGFARRGSRLGLLSSSKPGKPGKSIFGKPIPPEGRDSAFILGPGILKNKNELVAEVDGVFRAGRQWADIVPLVLPTWSVARSADGADWLLDYQPGDSRLPAPRAEAILEAAREAGAAEDALLPLAQVAALLAEADASGEPFFSKSIAPDRDGRAEVLVTPDATRASLSVWKGRGRGKRLDLAMVSQAIKEAGVRPAKVEQFKKDILEFYKGEAPELLDYVLVEGKAPTRGKDRTVALNASFLSEERAEEIRARLAAHPTLPVVVPSLHDFPLEKGVRLAHVQQGQRFGELSAQATGQPGVDIRGTVLPGIPGNDPAIKIYENVVVQKGQLSAAIAGLLIAQEKEGAYSFRVIPFKDSQVEVTLSTDAMTASVSLQAEAGLGSPLTVEGILTAIEQKGVVHGLDTKAVTDAIIAARSGQVVLRKPVAFGTPPRPAGSGKRVWLIGADAPSEGAKPAGGPFRVAAGTPLLRIEPASGKPVPGQDVLGKTVPAPEGPGAPGSEDIGIEGDATVKEGPAADFPGALLYTAAVPGELRVEGRRLSITERLVVDGDVLQQAGGLRFAGAILVSGSVRRGAQLFAGGDAQIAGQIEAALVSSDGSISSQGGVRGERRGTLRAKRSITVGFAEQALLLAVEDIRVNGSCALCSVKTNGRLFVTGDKGALVGGICRARKGLDATTLGSSNGIKTEVSFGQDYLMADMIEAEEGEIEKLKLHIVQSDRAMAEAESSGSGLDQVRQDKVKLIKLLEKRSLRLFDLREKYEEHFAASEVRIRGTVYPGVILESHNRFFEVRSKRTNVSFAFDPQQGRIVERQL